MSPSGLQKPTPPVINYVALFSWRKREPSCAKSEQSSCFIYMKTPDVIKGILKRIDPGPRMCLSSTDAYTVSLCVGSN